MLISRARNPLRFLSSAFCVIKPINEKTDYEKASIQLLLEPIKINISVDILRDTKQLTSQHAFKIFYTKARELNYYDCLTLMMHGEMVPLESKLGFDNFFNQTKRFLHNLPPDLSDLRIHSQLTIENFFKTFLIVEQNTRDNISILFLAFISYYCFHCEALTSPLKEKIMAELADRLYFPKLLLEYAKNEIPILPEVHEPGYVSIVLNRIRIVLGVVRGVEKGVVNINNNWNSLLSSYIKLLSQTLSNEQLFGQILKMPQTIFFPYFAVVPELKKGIFEYLLKILDPNVFHSISFTEDFFEKAFNFLLICSEEADREVVKKIMQKFIMCVQLFYVPCSEYQLINSSFIMLCERFDCQSSNLLKIVEIHYIYARFSFKSIYTPLNIKKNNLENKYHLLQSCFDLIQLFKLSKSVFSSSLRNLFISRVDFILDFQFNEFTFLEPLILQKEVEELRETEVPENSMFNVYQNIGQYLIEDQNEIIGLVEKTEQILKVAKDKNQLNDHTFPINLKTSMGARIRVLLEVLFYYVKIVGDPQKISRLFSQIENNSDILKRIQKYIWYPGLLQSFFFLYYEAIPHLESKNSRNPTFSINILLKNHREFFNRTFDRLMSKKEVETKKYQSIFFKRHLESISPSLCKNLSHVSLEKDLEMYLENSAQYEYTKRFPESRKRIHEELRNYFVRFPKNRLKVVPFYIEFPFITDFLIVYRGKPYTLFITEPEGQSFSEPSSEKYEEFFADEKDDKSSEKLIKCENMQEMSIKHFQQNSTIILVKDEEDLKNIFSTLERMR